jgi:hypothetical protein
LLFARLPCTKHAAEICRTDSVDGVFGEAWAATMSELGWKHDGKGMWVRAEQVT